MKIKFGESATFLVNNILKRARRVPHNSLSSVGNIELEDGTIVNQFELRLVPHLPTPSSTNPGVYYVKNIAIDRSSSDIIIRITRSKNELLIETTVFEGSFYVTEDFCKELNAYLGVKNSI